VSQRIIPPAGCLFAEGGAVEGWAGAGGSWAAGAVVHRRVGQICLLKHREVTNDYSQSFTLKVIQYRCAHS
jgi:hypothetical protein